MKLKDIKKEWPASYTRDEVIGLITYRVTSTPKAIPFPGIQEISILVFHYSSPHTPIGCLSAHIFKATSLLSLLYTRHSNHIDVHNCLRGLFTYQFHIREEILSHVRFKGTGVWGCEIEGIDLGYVDGIWTDARYRRRGIGAQMVGLLREVVSHHGVRYLITQPSYMPTASSWKLDQEEDWRPWDEDEKRPSYGTSETPGFCRFNRNFKSYYDIGFDGAKAFWRACGARRIGLKVWFGIALERYHPANKLPACKDAEDMHTQDRWRRMHYVCSKNEPHDIQVCERESQTPTMSFIIANAMHTLPDAQVDSLLRQTISEVRWPEMLKEVRRCYAHYPLLHIAIDHGKIQTIDWFARHFRQLVEKETNFDGYTALEWLRRSMEMSKERKFYGERDYGCVEKDYDMMMKMLLENKKAFMKEIAAFPWRSVW